MNLANVLPTSLVSQAGRNPAPPRAFPLSGHSNILRRTSILYPEPSAVRKCAATRSATHHRCSRPHRRPSNLRAKAVALLLVLPAALGFARLLCGLILFVQDGILSGGDWLVTEVATFSTDDGTGAGAATAAAAVGADVSDAAASGSSDVSGEADSLTAEISGEFDQDLNPDPAQRLTSHLGDLLRLGLAPEDLWAALMMALNTAVAAAGGGISGGGVDAVAVGVISGLYVRYLGAWVALAAARLCTSAFWALLPLQRLLTEVEAELLSGTTGTLLRSGLLVLPSLVLALRLPWLRTLLLVARSNAAERWRRWRVRGDQGGPAAARAAASVGQFEVGEGEDGAVSLHRRNGRDPGGDGAPGEAPSSVAAAAAGAGVGTSSRKSGGGGGDSDGGELSSIPAVSMIAAAGARVPTAVAIRDGGRMAAAAAAPQHTPNSSAGAAVAPQAPPPHCPTEQHRLGTLAAGASAAAAATAAATSPPQQRPAPSAQPEPGDGTLAMNVLRVAAMLGACAAATVVEASAPASWPLRAADMAVTAGVCATALVFLREVWARGGGMFLQDDAARPLRLATLLLVGQVAVGVGHAAAAGSWRMCLLPLLAGAFACQNCLRLRPDPRELYHQLAYLLFPIVLAGRLAWLNAHGIAL